MPTTDITFDAARFGIPHNNLDIILSLRTSAFFIADGKFELCHQLGKRTKSGKVKFQVFDSDTLESVSGDRYYHLVTDNCDIFFEVPPGGGEIADFTLLDGELLPIPSIPDMSNFYTKDEIDERLSIIQQAFRLNLTLTSTSGTRLITDTETLAENIFLTAPLTGDLTIVFPAGVSYSWHLHRLASLNGHRLYIKQVGGSTTEIVARHAFAVSL